MVDVESMKKQYNVEEVEDKRPGQEQPGRKPGRWNPQLEWIAGLRVVTVNVNSYGTLLRLSARWGSEECYDIILVQEHHENNEEKILNLHAQVAKWGWNSTWTPAVAKLAGTTGGTAILWRQGLPVVAPVVQTGITRAGGRSSSATLKWPKIRDIEFISLYLETGGQLSEHNIQILGDTAEHLANQGKLFWIGGDFQVGSEWLEELGWVQQVHGSLRVGDRRIGTCTAKTPASTIDYHVVHQKLDSMVPAAVIDLVSQLALTDQRGAHCS